MIWLARWLNQKTTPRDPVARRLYDRLWLYLIGPALILFFLWRHFLNG
jgi:hypothetical protein